MVSYQVNPAYKVVKLQEDNLTNQSLLDFIDEKGLNQASLATLIGVKRPTVNGWCRRGKKPSLKLYLHMCAVLKEDPKELNRKLGFDLVIPDVQITSRVEDLESSVSGLKSLVYTLQSTVAELQSVS